MANKPASLDPSHAELACFQKPWTRARQRDQQHRTGSVNGDWCWACDRANGKTGRRLDAGVTCITKPYPVSTSHTDLSRGQADWSAVPDD